MQARAHPTETGWRAQALGSKCCKRHGARGKAGSKRRSSNKSPPLPCFLLQRWQVSASQETIAGWSSPVARQAHNLKVIGSNPIPATNIEGPRVRSRAFFVSVLTRDHFNPVPVCNGLRFLAIFGPGHFLSAKKGVTVSGRSLASIHARNLHPPAHNPAAAGS